MGDVLGALFQPASSEAGPLAIVRDIRLPQGITALIAGMGLAVGGLLMQTVFRNPLAGPSVMGVSSGASLGVAIVMLARPFWTMLAIPPDALLILASITGAMGVLVLVMFADLRVGGGVTLLIVGLLIGHLCSAVIDVLQVAGNANALQGYVFWGMGTFGAVGLARLPWLLLPVLVGVAIAWRSIKPLNALLLGDAYATTMGVRVKQTRRVLLWTTGVLAGTITAFCGPIAFLGLITPHIARGVLGSNDHARLLPATLLCGAALALLCDLIARSSLFDGALPLNAVTSLLGVPVVAWVLLGGKRWARMS